jgi:predicted house-cleaning noncanonical NTP pyrophosphatase (MazG superfamily)
MRKLVRDNIPTIIVKEGKCPDFEHVSNIAPFVREKLQEELNEVLSATTRDELVSEMGDLWEVMLKHAVVNNISWAEVTRAARKKRERVGGFNNNVVLKL